MYRSYVSILLFLVSIICAEWSWAANTFVIKTKTARVFEKPSTRSSVLYTLSLGKKVHVIGLNKQGWAKVRVAVDQNFSFSGWMFKSSIGVLQNIRPNTQNKSNQRVSDLEKFFEPTKSTKDLSPRVKKPKKSIKPTKPGSSQKSNVTRKSELAALDPSFVTEILNLSATPTWAMHTYQVYQGTGQALKYTIDGMTAHAALHLKSPPLFKNKFFPSAVGTGTYGFLNTPTKLRDGNGNLFGEVTSKNKLIGWDARLHLLIEVYQQRHGNVVVGPTFGYLWSNFQADDVQDDNGDRSGLYVSHKRTSMIAGLRTEVTAFHPFKFILGMDVGFKNTYVEDPVDFTGSTPVPSWLYLPYVSLHFPLVKPHQFLGFEYRLMYQTIQMSGDSVSDRVGQTISSGSITESFHFAGLTYTFQF